MNIVLVYYQRGYIGEKTERRIAQKVVREVITMITSIIGLGVVAIGGVLLENHLVRKDKTAQADILNKALKNGIKIGGSCFIAYAFVKVVIMFL